MSEYTRYLLNSAGIQASEQDIELTAMGILMNLYKRLPSMGTVPLLQRMQ